MTAKRIYEKTWMQGDKGIRCPYGALDHIAA